MEQEDKLEKFSKFMDEQFDDYLICYLSINEKLVANEFNRYFEKVKFPYSKGERSCPYYYSFTINETSLRNSIEEEFGIVSDYSYPENPKPDAMPPFDLSERIKTVIDELFINPLQKKITSELRFSIGKNWSQYRYSRGKHGDYKHSIYEIELYIYW